MCLGCFCSAFPLSYGSTWMFWYCSRVKCWGRSMGGTSSAIVPLSPGLIKAGSGPDETSKQVCVFRFLNYRIRRNTDTQSIKK